MTDNIILYTGVFFDFRKEERDALLALAGWTGELTQKLSRVYLDHITLRYKPEPESDHLRTVLANEGEEVLLPIIGTGKYYESDVVARTDDPNHVVLLALQIDPQVLDDQFNLTCENQTPHLTVAGALGVAPRKANDCRFMPLCPDGSLLLPYITGKIGVKRVPGMKRGIEE